ncbi:N-acyl-D-amino-acid deacylase family protein [Gudongella sp. DL1XJH-153]|uniref:N-acyl-D-amino-acid deacylase family protein n=1 Tax=Gudongella sp. DL1XJH-153 TaxID=3409804 RepID=UPI003BB77F0F
MKRTLIKNVKIFDGTGIRPFFSDVFIEDENIKRIGLNMEVEDCEVVDGTNRILTPGFINTHSHSELEIFKSPELLPVIGQGITTEVLGQDGSSVTPIDDEHLNELTESMTPLCGKLDRPYWWRSYKDYIDAVEEVDPVVRYVGLVGHGTVRMSIAGSENRDLTSEELEEMCDIIDKSMNEGAKGVSFGMIYPPSSYAPIEELISVCKTVAKHDGIIMVHTRNEMGRLIESFEEMVYIMKQSGVRMHISHLKALGHLNWGKVIEILDRMKELNNEGYDITFDQYPWTAGSTGMKVIAPGWAYAGGEDAFQKRLRDPQMYEKILEETTEELRVRGSGKAVQIAAVPLEEWLWMCGLRLDEVAMKLKMEEPEAVLHILKETRSSVTCVYHSISEEDIQKVIQNPYHTVCTDGIVGEVPHPRAYSSYPRFLGRYVRDLNLIPLETAIKNITSEPARRLRLWDRGLIREGMSADLVLIDYENIIDTNTYANPKKLPKGILKVWVKGKLNYESKEI